MKPSVFSRIVSTVMAFAVVLASFSFKIEKHYCGSNLVEVSVISTPESCCVFASDDAAQLNKKSCCSNLSLVVEGFNNYQSALSSAFPSLATFVVVSTLEIPVEFIFETTTKHHYSSYNPPPLIADIQVRDQVFLI